MANYSIRPLVTEHIDSLSLGTGNGNPTESGVYVKKKQTFNLKDCLLDKSNSILVLPDSTNFLLFIEGTGTDRRCHSLIFVVYIGGDNIVNFVPEISDLLAIGNTTYDDGLSIAGFLDSMYMPIKSIEGEILSTLTFVLSKQIYDLMKDFMGWGSPELHKISDDVECFCIVPDLDFYEIYKKIIAAMPVNEASLLSLKDRLSIK